MLVCCLHRQLQAVAPAPGFAGIDQQLLRQVLVAAVTLREQLYGHSGPERGELEAGPASTRAVLPRPKPA